MAPRALEHCGRMNLDHLECKDAERYSTLLPGVTSKTTRKWHSYMARKNWTSYQCRNRWLTSERLCVGRSGRGSSNKKAANSLPLQPKRCSIRTEATSVRSRSLVNG